MTDMNDDNAKNDEIVETIISEAVDGTTSRMLDERFNEIILVYRAHADKFVVHDNISFHRIIVWFLKNLYWDDQLGQQQLLAEGLFVIERFCSGISKKGYEGIYYDLLNRNFDVEYFFGVFLEGLKRHHLSDPIKLACLRHIDPCDYRLKYAVMIAFVRNYGHLLRDEICQNPGHYINDFPEILKSVISAYENFYGVLSKT